jgi:hypothetical protein
VRKSKHDAAMFLLSVKAGLLGDDVMPLLRFMAGFDAPPVVADETIVKMERLEIMRRDVNLLDGKSVLLLTNYGKKIADVMRENRKDFAA